MFITQIYLFGRWNLLLFKAIKKKK